MSQPKLYYFDAPISRGEECRLALHAAGIDFEDVRLAREAWLELKPTTPFGSLPVLEWPGHPALAHSSAILVLIGRLHDLHPSEPFEAARHEALMGHCEDLRATVGPALRIADEGEKKKAREALATGYLPTWGGFTERQIGDGPFLAGAKLSVADLKIYQVVKWLVSGTVDHIPASIFEPFPKLTRLYEAVRDDARVRSWYAK